MLLKTVEYLAVPVKSVRMTCDQYLKTSYHGRYSPKSLFTEKKVLVSRTDGS